MPTSLLPQCNLCEPDPLVVFGQGVGAHSGPERGNGLGSRAKLLIEKQSNTTTVHWAISRAANPPASDIRIVI